jgi:hypothetical protein
VCGDRRNGTPALRIWLDDQEHRRIPVCQAISAKVKSLYNDLKKQMKDSAKDEPLLSASNG